MPTFQIEQYELHSAKCNVEATSAAEAVAKFLEGEGEPVDQSLEYIETADDYGMPAEDYPGLVRGLQKHGIDASDVIPSIRSIAKV